ncbi:CAP domain-containing protein [Tranquillimonas rosea]|uniref:CAP domain-containing protein n=1 Tax=Tranquillimonas rosea TaxID=641238 RepID=UPI003BA84F99
MMRTKIVGLLLVGAVLAGCAPQPSSQLRLGPDGRPLPQVYNLAAQNDDRVQFRMLDAVNSLREARGAPPVQLNAALNAAAATHSRDMSVQNRPWHFGSDGSSPLERVQRVGYTGGLLGENISETYETEIETLAAWMEQPDTRDIIVDDRARDMGIAWFQEPSGKIWWTLILGQPNRRSVPTSQVQAGSALGLQGESASQG